MSELSLRDKLVAQRKRLEEARKVQLTIPVTGYKQLIAARYRVLTGPEKQTIVARFGFDDLSDIAASGGEAAADMLINACEELMEVVTPANGDEPAQYAATGQRWSTQGVSSLFGVDLPEGATARQALFSVLDDEAVTDHFGEYVLTLRRIQDEITGEMVGESEPSQEGLSD